jgi:RHH-type proline utilization regulon transcriptional repressor/proline dehydrogenase/delta 1-pyrroline-5-carboxylate dehydrogenase
VAPTIIEIDGIEALRREVFGPVLHVVRYRREALPQLIAALNATGYGLTLGVHSRIDETIAAIVDRAHVGNIYVNRNIVGAVVGVQPFGGEGLSGTGPKAGGPLYLRRLQDATADGSVAPDALAAQLRQAGIETPRAADAALDALLDWSAAHGHQDLSALGRGYARDSLNGLTLRLPGPTGETNTLRFAERGAVLCLAGGTSVLLNQLAAVLATGNRAVLTQSSAAHLPASLPAPVMQRLEVVARHEDCAVLTLALYDADDAQCVRMLESLAQREGAIATSVATRAGRPVALWRLAAERAVCVNTTAAGGNASLMAMQS